MKTKYYKYTDKTKGWVSITKVEKKTTYYYPVINDNIKVENSHWYEWIPEDTFNTRIKNNVYIDVFVAATIEEIDKKEVESILFLELL